MDNEIKGDLQHIKLWMSLNFMITLVMLILFLCAVGVHLDNKITELETQIKQCQK